MIYLNNAALGWPAAPGVAEAIQSWLADPPEELGRTAVAHEDLAGEARRRVARVLGAADPDRIVFTLNATQSLNIAILGLNLPPGSLAITTVTEHNSVLRPLERLRTERGIRVKIVGFDSAGALDEDEFRKALAEGPRLVALNHASNVTGCVNDVGPFFRAAKAAGASTLLDASQTLGLAPVDAAGLHADLVAFPGHKGLHGPTGTGCLYVAPGIELDQTVVGGTGARSGLAHHPREMPLRLEAGTANGAGLAGLAAALRWFEHRGEAAREEVARLGERLRSGLRQIPRVRVFGRAGATTGVVSFGIEGLDAGEAGFILRESFGIVCRTGLHCAPLIHRAIGSAASGTIRFSASAFNTSEEIDAAIAAAGRLSQCAS